MSSKKLLLLALILPIGVISLAQTRSLGVRAGNGFEASYQHYLSDPHFLEVAVGTDFLGNGGFKATGTYNWVFARPDWTRSGEWSWYAGPGVSLGYVYDKGSDEKAEVMTALVLQLGLEYMPWNHLAISADIRPMIGYHFGSGDFYRGGLLGLAPCLALRYRFW